RARVRARGAGVPPIEISPVADDVMAAERPRAWGDVRVARNERTLRAAPKPFRPHPDAQRRDILPAELPDEDRTGHRIREPESPVRAGGGALPLVVQSARLGDTVARR